MSLSASLSDAVSAGDQSAVSESGGTKRSSGSSVDGDVDESPKRQRPSSRCLWLLIAPFDTERQSLPFTRIHLWPYLDDLDGLRGCCVNRATLQHYGSFPLKREFVLSQHQPQVNDLRDVLDNVVCFPAVTRLKCASDGGFTEVLTRALPRLQHLSSLDMLTKVNTSIDGLLPASLRELVLVDSVPITERTLPRGLRELKLFCGLPSRGLTLTKNVLPYGLRTLIYGLGEPIRRGVLPRSLRALCITTTTATTTTTTTIFPATLEPGCLPILLRLLTFTCKAEIAMGVLPAGLRELCLSHGEMPQLRNLLPADCKLKKLRFDSPEQPFTAASLPVSLEVLGLDDYSFPLDDALPPSLRRLWIDGSSIWLRVTSFTGCPQLQMLDLRFSDINQIPVGCLPSSLTTLLLPSEQWNEKLLAGSLPAGLQRLSIGGHYTRCLQPGLLPDGLRWLQLDTSFKAWLLRGSLPASLRQLRITVSKFHDIEPAFNQCLLHVFPQHSQLRILRIESLVFDTPLAPLSLPPRLQLLDLSLTAYNTEFTAGVLPPSLLRLRLGAAYEQPFTADSFACCQRLRELDIHRCGSFRHPLADLLPASVRLLRLPREYPTTQLSLPRCISMCQLSGT